MSRTLEQRYRDALRWYPKRWREENGDVVVGTLLDVAEAAQRTTPDRRELAHLAASGIRARLSWIDLVAPAGVRERAGAILLATGFGLAVMMLVMQEWAPWSTTRAWDEFGVSAPSFGPFLGAGSLLYLVWIAGSVLAVAGLPRVGKVILLLEVPIVAGICVFVDAGDLSRPSSSLLAAFVVLALSVALAPPLASRALAGRTALFGLVFAVGAVAYWVLVFGTSEHWLGSWGWRRLLDVGWAPLAGLAVAGFALLLIVRKRDWAEGLALASVVMVAVITVPLTRTGIPELALLEAGFVTTCVLAALVVTVTFTRGYRLRLAPPA